MTRRKQNKPSSKLCYKTRQKKKKKKEANKANKNEAEQDWLGKKQPWLGQIAKSELSRLNEQLSNPKTEDSNSETTKLGEINQQKRNKQTYRLNTNESWLQTNARKLTWTAQPKQSRNSVARLDSETAKQPQNRSNSQIKNSNSRNSIKPVKNPAAKHSNGSQKHSSNTDETRRKLTQKTQHLNNSLTKATRKQPNSEQQTYLTYKLDSKTSDSDLTQQQEIDSNSHTWLIIQTQWKQNRGEYKAKRAELKSSIYEA